MSSARPSVGTTYDLIVVGLGALGSAALFHATEAGLRVLGIDRYDPPHDFGSSHAESRMTRLAVGEGPQYLPFVARSHEIWRALEGRSGMRLLYQPGGYFFGTATSSQGGRWGDFARRSESVARAAGIEFERRTPTDVERHLPNVRLRGDEMVGFEPTGGIVLCEQAVAVQLALARAAGAQTLTHQVVSGVEPDAYGVTIVAGDDAYKANKVIVATGPWFGDLAPASDACQVRVTRQVVYWFEVDDPECFSALRFPFLVWADERAEDYLGVFPMVPGGLNGLKVLSEQFDESTHPNSVERQVFQLETKQFYEQFVRKKLRGVTPTCLKATVCLYANTPDDNFLVDTHPESERVLFASPCSGHGFKHSTALAQAMVQRVMTGASDLDLQSFGRERFAAAQ